MRHPRGDSTPPYYGNDSGYFKGSSSHSQEHLYDVDISSLRSTHRSGPLDYGARFKFWHYWTQSTC
ncbi:hypothetical protein MtrunA17_Chr4g0042231 [Medicago truncatula]|uniref:Uncharacterized protein n=1 Tax=Medicago truncatula TaxID=3880 RepID=A0A396I8L2_MEDTR|nr:hypothetical protein MtrunA17_Chr4g0042231 [Medicago truncatula]